MRKEEDVSEGKEEYSEEFNKGFMEGGIFQAERELQARERFLKEEIDCLKKRIEQAEDNLDTVIALAVNYDGFGDDPKDLKGLIDDIVRNMLSGHIAHYIPPVLGLQSSPTKSYGPRTRKGKYE